MFNIMTATGGKSCTAGRANAPPEFDARGENRSFTVPLFNGFTLTVVQLKFGEN